ncbi:septum formation initiator family protein [Sphingomicrobium sp. XHP0235]|uniref:FtsB family cell division protein n=1 Tax=Sphingomicrobium aquimarinum TaxID=3133971 RepID=UPI0031FE72C9
MSQKSRGLVRRIVVPLVAFVIIGNFAGYAIAGDNGLLAWGGHVRALDERKAELAALEAERDALRHRSQLLDPKAADPDIAEELVRRDLGLIRDDEIIIPLD